MNDKRKRYAALLMFFQQDHMISKTSWVFYKKPLQFMKTFHFNLQDEENKISLIAIRNHFSDLLMDVVGEVCDKIGSEFDVPSYTFDTPEKTYMVQVSDLYLQHLHHMKSIGPLNVHYAHFLNVLRGDILNAVKRRKGNEFKERLFLATGELRKQGIEI